MEPQPQLLSLNRRRWMDAFRSLQAQTWGRPKSPEVTESGVSRAMK